MKKNKKILMLHPSCELYGADRMFLLSIKAILHSFNDAEIAIILPCPGLLSEKIKAELPSVKIMYKNMGILRKSDIKKGRLGVFIRIFTFFRWLSYLSRFDFLYINTIVVADIILASRWSRVRTIIHVHELPRLIESHFFNKLLSFSKADLVFISQAVKVSLGILPNKSQTIIWNGISEIKCNHSAMQKDPKLNFLMIGRLNAWKGQDFLLESIAKLPNFVKSNLKVTILGDVYGDQNHYRVNIQNLISKYGLGNTVILRSFVPNTENYYCTSDIVIVPSLRPEPFGLVAIEAMSAGKPVIAANHGGLTEIVVHNETGLLFEPGNPTSLAEAITFAIHNPLKMQQMGSAGKKRYEEHFTEEIYMCNLKEIL